MARHFRAGIGRKALGVASVLLLFVTSGGEMLDAQRRPASTSKPAWKGVWEAVSYPEDVNLNDVFFVNADVGWVTSGDVDEGGMLLRTGDAGATWNVELGDHESKEPPFYRPYFLDETLGWVLQAAGIGKHKLLRTADGESWQQVGALEAPWGLLDYVFVSKSLGFYLDGNDNNARIMRTADGGRTWRNVFQCRAKVVIDGLSRDVTCTFKALHFPTPDVGYAIGGGHGAKRTLFVAKTEDGGNRWTLFVISDIGGDLEVYYDQELFFTDERTGFAHLSENRLYRTDDGGKTWTGLVGTPGSDIKFADPEVGWSFNGPRLSYTTDGGKRWSSREFEFPARVRAFSIPRRTRGYVVGEHGMVFRYSVVPSADPTPPNAVPAPAMPGLESELDDQMETVEEEVEALEEELESATDSVADSPANSSAEAAADTVSVVEECCAESVSEVESAVNAMTPLVPQFLAKYRNVNLIIAGLQFLGLLPDHLADTKAALAKLRQAKGPTATAAALAELTAAVEVLGRTTRQAFQKEPVQLANGGAADAPTSQPAMSAESSAEPGDAPAAESAESDAGVKAAEEKAKKSAKDEANRALDAAKKKLKIRFP